MNIIQRLINKTLLGLIGHDMIVSVFIRLSTAYKYAGLLV